MTKGTYVVPTISYLHEREHKRELRPQSAKEGTQIAGSRHEDLERNLIFNLRTAFVGTLQAKAMLPAAMSHGIGSDSQRPFAIVIVGGLIADLVMSILLLPTLYVWVARDKDVLPIREPEFEN